MTKKAFIIASLIVFGCILYAYFTDSDAPTQDALRFKKEYEQYNDQIKTDGSGYLSMSLSTNNPIKYADVNQIINILENKTGIIYLGFPTCPWCRSAVPSLIEAAEKEDIDTIYYYNALSIRDTKGLDEKGVVQTTKEGTPEYYQLLERLGNVADVYEGLNDPSIKRIYFPTVIFVKDGMIVGDHKTTVESHTSSSVALDKDQKKELVSIYRSLIKRIK